MSILLENLNTQNFNSALFNKHRNFSFVKNLQLVNPDQTALDFSIQKVPQSFLRIDKIEVSFINAFNVAGAAFTDSNDFSGYLKFKIKDIDGGQTFVSHVIPIEKKFTLNNVVVCSDTVITNNITLNILSADIKFMFNGGISPAPEFQSFNLHFLISVTDYPKNDYDVTPSGVVPKHKLSR